MCAIYGPIAPRVSNREMIDRGVVSVVFGKGVLSSVGGAEHAGGGEGGMKPLATPLPPGGGATERELESFVRDALSSCIMLERYPRCVIQVVIQILQSDGSMLGTAVNCAIMALMDAGVAMRGLAVANTVVIVNPRGSDGQQQSKESLIWVDPTAEEESAEGHSIVVLVSEASASSESPGIVTSFTYGAPMSMQGLLHSVKSVDQCNAAMVAFMRMAVEQKVQREIETLWS